MPEGSAPLVTLPSPDLLPTPSASPHPHPSSAQSAPASLSEQLRHLERARAALDAGDGATAERLVDEYEARYRGGAFVQEAEVLRIEASLQRRNRARAERLEATFLEKFPKSPHAARVRALLDSNP
ncbi:hypothetical protein AKJ09_07412 [Labilithrix luteola]|uniref:Uncharacterized protein n=1 Tax=Labilithrix luteola TaxID=1391654 RepID=A0A0K1Q4W2_9BACT|nr:hypothetical protein AKJ09_07412 [Labilithrix luteola]